MKIYPIFHNIHRFHKSTIPFGKKTHSNNNDSTFPPLLFDSNHIYRFDSNQYGNTGYYICVNNKISNIKCKARRILRNCETIELS